ncbi:MAG: hypothetical protein ACK46A_05020, partial [Akkermansiaceae bacterium]
SRQEGSVSFAYETSPDIGSFSTRFGVDCFPFAIPTAVFVTLVNEGLSYMIPLGSRSVRKLIFILKKSYPY